jgi:cellulase (glycosyl hydrolase family 5)
VLTVLATAIVTGVGGASLVVGTNTGARRPVDPVRAAALRDLEAFEGWLRRYGVRGYVGEVGWPARNPAEAAAWNRVADAWYRSADRDGLWVTAWATGAFDSSYPLALYAHTATGLRPRPQGAVVERHASRRGVLRGVVVAGGEFGTDDPAFSNASPGAYGTAYRYDPPQTFRALARRGIVLVRLPFRWERVQPQLGGELDPAEVARIRQAVATAHAAGLVAILDLHNYGEYRTPGGAARLGAEIDEATFADTWRRLALAFTTTPGLLGYDLMNEPARVQPTGSTAERTWETFSQAAVAAIRSTGDRHVVFIEGYPWSAAADWSRHHPRPWISDPLGKIRYEAHAYWDADRSGRYSLSYADERAAAERRRSETEARSSRAS